MAVEIFSLIVLLYWIFIAIRRKTEVQRFNELPWIAKLIVLVSTVCMPLWYLILYYVLHHGFGLNRNDVVAFFAIPTALWYLLEWGCIKQYTKIMDMVLAAEPNSCNTNGFSSLIAIIMDSLVCLIAAGLIALQPSLSLLMFTSLIFSCRIGIYIVMLTMTVIYKR